MGATTKNPKAKAKSKQSRKAGAKKTASKRTAPKPKREGKLSGLDAAAKILGDNGKPMRCKEIVDEMLAKKLWQTNGVTPHATIYAAVIREIAQKGKESRFKKVGRGQFALTGTGA